MRRNDALQRIQSLIEQSDALYYKDRLAALAATEQALELLAQFDDVALRAASLRTMGQLLIASAQLDDAQPYYQDALALYEQLPQNDEQTLGRARCYLGLGGIAKRRSHYDDALVYQRKAATLAGEVGDALLEAKSRNNLGLTHWSMDSLDAALEQFFEALRLLSTFEDDESMMIRASIHSNAGLIFASRDDLQFAVEQYQEAMHIVGRTEFAIKEANFAFRLAEIFLELKQLDEASVYFERAQTLMDQDPAIHHSDLLEVRAHLATLDTRWDAALGYFEQALDVYTTNEDVRQQACVLIYMARIAASQSDWVSCEQWLEMAWSRASSIEDGQFMRAACRERIECYRAQAKWASAFECSEQMRALEQCLATRHRDAQLAAVDRNYQMESQAQAARLWKEHSESLEAQVQARTAEMEEANTLLLSEVLRHQHTVRQLERARDAAEAASRAKSSFLAVASHELRTPLNAIIGYAQLVLEDVSDGLIDEVSMSRDLGRVLDSAHHLLSMIEDILELARLESGEQTLDPKMLSLQSLFDMLDAHHRPQLGDNTLSFGHDLPSEQSSLYVDQHALVAVMNQLIANAIKFTDGGEIRVDATINGAHCEFQVTDSGVGLDPAMAHKIFEAFEQEDFSSTRTHGGLGIGLALCQHYTQLLGGQLKLDMQWRDGARFVVQLPRAILVAH